MDDIRPLRRTDYTRYIRPRRTAAESPAKASVKEAASDTMTISIRFSLPRFYEWKAYGFIKQYPYISVAAAAAAFVGLVLAGDALSWLWHAVHNRGIRG
ncbi:MAG TPA: hypothetical protein VFJ84_03795 [Candidatus Saccharimonadales bacterium]|nr:hypothetical protein [Candidatus Saccharimonadales bacterium]